MTLREGADHCAASAFLYLYYRQSYVDCQAQEIAILPSQIPLPAPRGYASCGVAFCRFLWYPLSRKALSNQTQAAIAPHRSRCLALRSKASAGGQLFGVPLPTLKVKGGMPYDYIGNSIAFPDDHRTVGTSRKCCTSDGRPEKG